VYLRRYLSYSGEGLFISINSRPPLPHRNMEEGGGSTPHYADSYDTFVSPTLASTTSAHGCFGVAPEV